jgi:hypothetical protein
MAIRQAFGGARIRLFRLPFTESLLLSLLGGIAGLSTLGTGELACLAIGADLQRIIAARIYYQFS